MIENPGQFELAEQALSKLKRFLVTARRTHSPEAYAALAAPVLREIQERERDLLVYLSEPQQLANSK